MQQSMTSSTRHYPLSKSPLSWNHQASSGPMESGPMGAQFCRGSREDACVGHHMARHLRTFACFCGHQRGRAMAAKAEHLKNAKYATGQPSLCPFCHGKVWCAWSDSTRPRLGHWATPVPGNRGGTQQGVPPPKNRHCSTEGECCSSARDLREAGGSLLGVTDVAPSPLYYCFIFTFIFTIIKP